MSMPTRLDPDVIGDERSGEEAGGINDDPRKRDTDLIVDNP